MATQSTPPLDELQHRRADIIEWWVNEMGGRPMDENMIHRYLAESPFFDHSTKNGLHFLHARSNMAEFELVKDRRRFEEDLKRHVGGEYLIVGEPQDIQSSGKGGGKESTGIYVLRKQDRQRTRAVDGRVEEELTTLGTYYCVGEKMYQAPSVGDIVGNRLLSATANLSKFFETAASLPTFSPTAGYTYLPQSTQTSATRTSTQASPSRSREASVLPTTATAETQSLRSTSLGAADTHTSNPSFAFTSGQDTRLLAHSFKQSLEFRDEYADENPLVGEPGHLSFTSSLAAVKAQKRKAADEEAAALAARAAMGRKEEGKEAVVKVEEKVVAEPPAVMNAAQAKEVGREREREKERRGSRIGDGKKRRTKSKANLGSVVGVADGSGVS